MHQPTQPQQFGAPHQFRPPVQQYPSLAPNSGLNIPTRPQHRPVLNRPYVYPAPVTQFSFGTPFQQQPQQQQQQQQHFPHHFAPAQPGAVSSFYFRINRSIKNYEPINYDYWRILKWTSLDFHRWSGRKVANSNNIHRGQLRHRLEHLTNNRNLPAVEGSSAVWWTSSTDSTDQPLFILSSYDRLLIHRRQDQMDHVSPN